MERTQHFTALFLFQEGGAPLVRQLTADFAL